MTDLLTKAQINTNFSGSDQKEVLTKLANWAVELGIAVNAEQLVKDYQAREQESTTGFGNGIAIPHAKSNNIDHAAILVARGTTAVEWASLDDKPVNVWISLLVPDDQADTHLKLLAKLSRQLIHQDFIQLLQSGSADEIYTRITAIIS
ncbi:PTS fructose transporter subunit IIA [Loigolactobacillus binensis]|uniref:PTS fructose transporter subunit IIA n=1 Tax=Loigolactobacillus binensis TaxID=2559922 RepID=A0ABW3EB87_9LACO|nr:PTS fructose transporter subunit IIA [Loigolactobacillus binensis]